MGYRAEKDKVEKKSKRLKFILLGIGVVALAIVILITQIFPVRTWKYSFGLPNTGNREAGEMRIHFLCEERNGATVVELPDGKILLIDGGGAGGTSEKTLLRYLNALDVDEIDYLVVTSTKESRCGGLEEVLQNKKVSQVYLPTTTPVTGSEYAKFYAQLIKENCERVYYSRNMKLPSNAEQSKYAFACLYPYTLDAQASLEKEESAFWLTYAGVNFLFSDISAEAETLLMRDDSLGLLKNHGIDLRATDFIKLSVGNAPSEKFLGYLGAERLNGEMGAHTVITITAD